MILKKTNYFILKRREKRAKLQTDSTNKLENAIEQLENSTQDEIRYNHLKEKQSELIFETKPILGETKVLGENDLKTRTKNLTFKDRRSRTRSLSSSGQFDHVFNDKYAHVKPKTLTRLPAQSARTNDESMKSQLNDSKRDQMNDSVTLRQNIYQDWYQKKMMAAKEQLREAQQSKKDEEEKKAQVQIIC